MELSKELKEKHSKVIDFVISLPLEKWEKPEDNIFITKYINNDVGNIIEFKILSEHFLHVKYNSETELIKSDIRLNEYQKKLVMYFDKIECSRKESYFDKIINLITKK